MGEEQPIYIFPRADQTSLLIAAAIFIALLVGAFLAEGWRRRRDRKLRLEAEWRAVDEVTKEREFTADEKQLLRSFLERQAPQHPFKTITTRIHFDDCVAKELARYPEGSVEQEQRGVLLRDVRNRLGLDHVPIGQRINTTRELFPGQPLWISLEGEGSKNWQAMVVSSVDEAKFAVAPKEGTLPRVKADQRIHCRMWREEDARYVFDCRLLRLESEPQQLVVQHAENLHRTQSRAHLRVRFDHVVDVSILSAPADGDERDAANRPVVARMRGRVSSLSAGGLAVVVGQPVPTVVFLRMELQLEPETEPLLVVARMVEAVPLTGGRYLLRGAFISMEDETRDLIAHYVFRQQQQQQAAAPPTAA